MPITVDDLRRALRELDGGLPVVCSAPSGVLTCCGFPVQRTVVGRVRGKDVGAGELYVEALRLVAG